MSHYFPHSHKKNKSSKQNHMLDILIYPVALVSPIMTIPQLTQIWVHGNAAGISLATWSSYAIVSGFWFIYGLHHKEKPVIISGLFLFVLQSAIVLGVLLYR